MGSELAVDGRSRADLTSLEACNRAMFDELGREIPMCLLRQFVSEDSGNIRVLYTAGDVNLSVAPFDTSPLVKTAMHLMATTHASLRVIAVAVSDDNADTKQHSTGMLVFGRLAGWIRKWLRNPGAEDPYRDIRACLPRYHEPLRPAKSLSHPHSLPFVDLAEIRLTYHRCGRSTADPRPD
jgi:hypothetical protein